MCVMESGGEETDSASRTSVVVESAGKCMAHDWNARPLVAPLQEGP